MPVVIPEFPSADEALLGVLTEILRSGITSSPRGRETREVLGFGFVLRNPRARLISLPARCWSESLAVGELCWHLSQSDDLDFVAYYAPKWQHFSDDGRSVSSSCYGKRIFGGGPDSQWGRVHQILAMDSSSRRGILTLVDEKSNLRAAKDVACISSIQFLVREGRLNCITTMRSCDAIWGLCYDLYFCTMLQEMMATQLNVNLGWYRHMCGSLHVYEQFYSMASRIVAEGLASNAEAMAPLTDLSALPQFLRLESALRKNLPGGLKLFEHLPDYWRTLAAPLLHCYARRWSNPAQACEGGDSACMQVKPAHPTPT